LKHKKKKIHHFFQQKKMTTKWTDLEKIIGRPGPFAAESFSADAAKVKI